MGVDIDWDGVGQLAEADFLEVLFSDEPGYVRETERVDLQGNLLGFSVLNVSQLPKDQPVYARLAAGKVA